MTTVHLDTSVMLEHFKRSSNRQRVASALAGYTSKSSSTYAKYEFKKTWLRDLHFLHSRTFLERVRRPEDLIEEIRRSFAPNQINRLCRCLEVWCAAIEKFGPAADSARLLRLRNHLARAIMNGFSQWAALVGQEHDHLKCGRAREEPTMSKCGRIDACVPRCTRDVIQCDIQAFFAEHLSIFRDIAIRGERLDASPQLRVAALQIREAERASEHLCDDHVCQKLGDALIAVDGLEMEELAANNDRDWIALSEVLGKRLINPLRKGS